MEDVDDEGGNKSEGEEEGGAEPVDGGFAGAEVEGGVGGDGGEG